MNIPLEVVNMILVYDGKIKYRNGIYSNIIHKYDKRYDMLKLYIEDKQKCIENIEIEGTDFYIEVCFNRLSNRGLCYASGNCSSAATKELKNEFIETCYFNLNTEVEQIRTYM